MDVPTLYYVVSPFAIVALILVFTRISTTLAYYSALRDYKDSPVGGAKIVDSPQIPYWLPFLGNTTSFLTTTPKKYWQWLFTWHPRSTGVLTLMLGGQRTHILFSPTAVQAMFKARTPSRDAMERDMFSKVFDMPVEQIDNAAAGKHFEHEMNSQYLTNFHRVNELTTHFTKGLDEVLGKDAVEMTSLPQIGLYDWVRDRMFTASVNALLGEKLLEQYPNYCEDFFGFDSDFMSFFFGLPSFIMGEAISRKKRLLDRLEKWSADMHKLSGGAPIDPEGPAWEPYFGSRLNRARQLDYKNRNLNSRSSAALDLGITFGLASNAIPSTGWMLFHILDPRKPTLLPRVLAEIDASTVPGSHATDSGERAPSTLDITTLMQQPLLNSIWTETLRLYVDVLVTRNLPEDITLPLDEDRKREVRLRKGDNIFAPGVVAHEDPASWTLNDAAPDRFCADRFLVRDPKTGEDVFNMGRTAGKFFPFGGGKTICPGRHFAKQESVGALALILLRFNFEFKGFVGKNKEPTQDFPGLPKMFPGSGALTPGGDMLVKISKRQT